MLNNTADILDKFAKRVISRSRANLTRNKNNTSKNLYNSLDYKQKVMPNSMMLEFIMNEYGLYIDQGVKGANPKLMGDKGKQKAPFSKYSYKDKMPPLEPILAWVKAKKIRFRNKKGQFTKATYLGAAFAIQKSIYAQGIKPSLFFTKPFKSAFNDLPQELVDAYKLDIEYFIKNINTK